MAAATRSRRKAAAARTGEQVLDEVRTVAARIVEVDDERERLYAARARLFHEGRGCDPKVTQAALATAAGVSETAVITALRKPAPEAPANGSGS